MVLVIAFATLTKTYLFCYKPGSLAKAGESGRGLIRDPHCLLTLRRSHISLGSKVSAANIVTMTTPLSHKTNFHN